MEKTGIGETEFILTPATGRNFIGRSALISELTRELGDVRSHIGFCLYGRRRVGKTSILEEVAAQLSGKSRIVVVYLSLYDIADLSAATFAQELADAVMAAYHGKGVLPMKLRLKELLGSQLGVVAELLKGIRLEATVAEHIKLMVEHAQQAGGRENRSEFIRQAFNTGEVLAKATATKCVLMLDEFPEMAWLDGGLQLVKMLRTQYERQSSTALVISGSIKKTLELVALSQASPFYKQLVPKHVMPFTREETEQFLRSYLGDVGVEDLSTLHELTGGMPFYLQFIGRSTRYSGKAQRAVDEFIAQEGDLFFREEFEKLSGKERLIVASLCEGPRSMSEIAEMTSEPATTVGRYLPNLMDEDVITRESRGTYALSDRLFAYWIGRKLVR